MLRRLRGEFGRTFYRDLPWFATVEQTRNVYIAKMWVTRRKGRREEGDDLFCRKKLDEKRWGQSRNKEQPYFFLFLCASCSVFFTKRNKINSLDGWLKSRASFLAIIPWTLVLLPFLTPRSLYFFSLETSPLAAGKDSILEKW